MAKLTKSDRENLPKSDFAVKSKAKTKDQKGESGNYPMPDAAHAKAAIGLAAMHHSPQLAHIKSVAAKKFPGVFNDRRK